MLVKLISFICLELELTKSDIKKRWLEHSAVNVFGVKSNFSFRDCIFVALC